jgi:hypothetical protein
MNVLSAERRDPEHLVEQPCCRWLSRGQVVSDSPIKPAREDSDRLDPEFLEVRITRKVRERGRDSRRRGKQERLTAHG